MGRAGTDPIVQHLIACGRPLTRVNYLAVAFPNEEPDAERLDGVPEEIRALQPGEELPISQGTMSSSTPSSAKGLIANARNLKAARKS
jgi:hypothetical protein